MQRAVVRLPIIWHKRNMDVADQASKAMQVTSKIIRSIDDVFGFSLVIAARNGGMTEAWFEVEGFEDQRTLRLASRISVLITSHSTWLGLGEAQFAPIDSPVEHRFEIVPSVGAVLEAHHTWSPAWEAAARFDGRVDLRVSVGEIIESDDDMSASMSVSVSGTSGDAELVAVSFAQELSVVRQFRAQRLECDVSPRRVTMSVRECGRALATPARIAERVAWADAPLRGFDGVLQQVRSSIGAVSIFGGSGCGKTTLMEHIADACLEDETIVAICPHGELSARLAALASRRGVPFDAMWFGDPVAPPAFNLLEPPHSSITLGDWLPLVPEIILSTHRALGLTYDMAGPAWYHNFSAATEVLAVSGVGTILDTAALLSDPELSEDLEAAMGALTDPGLLRRIREARRAITRSTDGSYAVFQNSKLHFLQAPRVKAVFGRRYNSFSLDKVFEEGRHLFVSASAAELGEHGAAVAVTALLTAIYEVARRQSPERRRRVRLMIPEAHLVNPSLLCSLLAEGRKFGIVGTVVDLQTPTTLDRRVLTSLLGNSGAIASFRLAPADAAVLDGRYPSVTRIQQLPPFRMALTFGDSDGLVDTRPPLSDPSETSAFVEAHRRSQDHEPGRGKGRNSSPIDVSCADVLEHQRRTERIVDHAAARDLGAVPWWSED